MRALNNAFSSRRDSRRTHLILLVYSNLRINADRRIGRTAYRQRTLDLEWKPVEIREGNARWQEMEAILLPIIAPQGHS